MQATDENNKQSILEEIEGELANQLTTQAAGHAAVFSEVFFKRVPVAELSQETPGFFADMVISQLSFLQRRKHGDLSIRVFNP